MGRLLSVLIISVVTCTGLYYLFPDTVGGIKLKKVDLLADIRVAQDSSFGNYLLVQGEQEDLFCIDSMIAIMHQFKLKDTLSAFLPIDSASIKLRNSLYQVMYAVEGADSLGTRIEDYSVGHVGLRRFFAALSRRQWLGRPVRIAFMGDSFIEGDITVANFRESMQEQFGGQGVGFVPIQSVDGKFRPTINQKAEGWVTYSLPTHKKYRHILSGMIFEGTSNQATLSFKTSLFLPSLKKVSSLKFLYEQNESTLMQLVYNGDTLVQALPPSSSIQQFVLNDSITEGKLTFTNAKGFRAFGLVLEGDSGIVVDNYAKRGNSGVIFEHLNQEDCHAFGEIRPYDLIVLQYGLNVASKGMFQYGWYCQSMTRTVQHLQKCFPDSDILLLGISDRASLQNGKYQTMPEVLALLHAQCQVARQTGITFWNTFDAMGGKGSIVRYSAKGWAGKDFTHLNFKGGA